MNIRGKIPYLIVAMFAWVVIISSCANQGMPTGGPRDSIPPVLVGTSPKFRALNFQGDEIRLTFNEYIIADAVREQLVISPPLTKRPTIRTKSKTLVVQFNEDLKDSITYSLDFKNSIVDNNERNEYKNFRFSFSTGNVFDTLRVAGLVTDAFNLEPKEKALVMLYKNLHDSAVFTLIPDYIARTDEKGLFLIDNIAPGSYHIFSITDNNNDLMYNEGAEEIAFTDTVVVPRAKFIAKADTLVKGADSLLITGHTRFYPDPFYLRQFTEDIFDQYISSYDRQTRYKGTIIFNESVRDTFNFRLLNNEKEDWYLLEHNSEMDSLTFWIADTLTAKIDTLITELSYYQLDSLGELYVKKDTLEFSFTDKEVESKPKRKQKNEEEDEGPEPIEQFSYNNNIKTTPFDLNKKINIVSPQPLKSFDHEKVILYLTSDTLKKPLNIVIQKDTSAWRTYTISYPWEPQTNYTFQIDSAASTNIYGITNKELIKKFTTRDEDYYGTININMTKVESPVIVQVLKNNEQENVIKQKIIEKDQAVVFDFLPPEKYKIKAIYDVNGNGKWDPGSYQDQLLPEGVAYINEVIKVRSNWDSTYDWKMSRESSFVKNIRDVELEEQKRKEAEEKAIEEQRREQQQNNMYQGGQGYGGSGIIRR